MRVGGIVLCGGQSRRMGRPKAWLPFGDETMLARVVRLLGEAVDPVVVVAAPNQDVPALPAEVEVARDQQRNRGPLAGLAAGLQALRGQVDAAFLSSCDAPFLHPAFVRRMIDLLDDHQICVPRTDDYYHPLAAVYRLEVADAAMELLAHNRLRPVFLFEKVDTRIAQQRELIDVDSDLRSLRNLNTPQHYQAALHELQMRKQ